MCNNNLHFFIFVSFYYPKQSLNRQMRPDAYALFIRKPYHTAVERVKLLGDFLPPKIYIAIPAHNTKGYAKA